MRSAPFSIKTLILLSAAVVATLSAATGSWAQAAPLAEGSASTPRIDRREARQEQRIEKGVASGALTPREAGRLDKEQALIDRAQDKAQSDGVVSAQERHRLSHLQNRASHDIRRQKHDRQASAKP